MSQRVIIAGGGRVGARTARVLGDHGHDPVVIERDSRRSDQLADPRHGIVITGDATHPEVVSQADPDRADAFAALTGDNETNRRLCELIDDLTNGVRTVARIEGEDPADVADRTVEPAAAGAKAAASAILEYGYAIRDRPATGFDLVEFDVDPRAPAAQKQLASVSFPEGSHVIADTETMTVAGPRTRLRPGHRYLVAVEPPVADDTRNLLRG